MVAMSGSPNARVLWEPMYSAETTSRRRNVGTLDAARKIAPLWTTMNAIKTLSKCAVNVRSSEPASLCSAVRKAFATMPMSMTSLSLFVGSLSEPSARSATPGIKRVLIPNTTGTNASRSNFEAASIAFTDESAPRYA